VAKGGANGTTSRASPWLMARARSRATDVAVFVLVVGGLLWLIVEGAGSMNYRWQWHRVPQFIVRVIDDEWIEGPLLRGLLVTVQISGLAMAIALAWGFFVAVLRMGGTWSGKVLSVYVEVVRNTPILVQIFVFYFVLGPILGINRFWVGVLTLALFEATFVAEVIRGGILSVARGQWEAARAVGLTERQVYTDVILPQAVPLMLPPMTGILVNLIKHSAIVSAIAMFDLATEGRNIIADTFMTFEIWLTVAGIYLVMTVALSSLAQGLEFWLRRRG
jgi:polar amino acid transport system permease protein